MSSLIRIWSLHCDIYLDVEPVIACMAVIITSQIRAHRLVIPGEAKNATRNPDV